MLLIAPKVYPYRQRTIIEWYVMPVLISYIYNNIIEIVIEQWYVVSGCKALYSVAAVPEFRGIHGNNSLECRLRVPHCVGFAYVCVNIQLAWN